MTRTDYVGSLGNRVLYADGSGWMRTEHGLSPLDYPTHWRELTDDERSDEARKLSEALTAFELSTRRALARLEKP